MSYVYEQKITVVVRAEGLDSAYRKGKELARELEQREGVERAAAYMTDLKYRPDRGGSLR